MSAIEISNYKPGKDIFIALDIASSEFFENEKYILKGESKSFSSSQLIDYYKELTNKYPIISIEDGLHENDWVGWAELTKKIGNKYISVGSSMGKAINIAVAFDAYILSDKATWLNHKNKGNLEIQFEGDLLLHNQYSFLPINKNKHSHVESKLVKRIEEWLVSERAKKLINSYIIDEEQVFTFNAK